MPYVLLVDDETDMSASLAALIQRKGCRVITASSAEEALQMIRSDGNPCLILLDLVLPRMTGWQLRVELLSRNELALVPVVLLSGLPDLEQHAKVLRVADYLGKPVNLDKLYSVLETYWRPESQTSH